MIFLIMARMSFTLRTSMVGPSSGIFQPTELICWAWQVCLHRPFPSVPDECETAFQQAPVVFYHGFGGRF